MEIPAVGADLFHADARHDVANCFCSQFANALKKRIFYFYGKTVPAFYAP